MLLAAQRYQNGAQKLTFGSLGVTFSVKIRDSGPLTKSLFYYSKTILFDVLGVPVRHFFIIFFSYAFELVLFQHF